MKFPLCRRSHSCHLLPSLIAVVFVAASAAFGAPDLIPLNISVGEGLVTAGRSVTVRYTVRNQGDTNAPASHVKIQIKDAANVEVVAQEFPTQAINATSSVSEQRAVTIPSTAAAGVYNAFVIVDNNREVAQQLGPNGSDSSAGVAFTVQKAAIVAADLLPQNVSVSPTPVIAGKTISISYTVRNQGAIHGSASHTKIQIKNASSVEVVAQDFPTQAIDALSAVIETREVTIPSTAAAGTYKAFVIVDNNREVLQEGATENDASHGVTFAVQGATQ